MYSDAASVEQRVSTGRLPAWDQVQRVVDSAHSRYRDAPDGVVADYIPVLAAANPDLFGVCVAGIDGRACGAGDVDVEFSIQSISKAFVYALVCEERGHREVMDLVGVNNTGLAFNSVMALELNDGHPRNPMVNAGAIATTALLPGTSAAEKWEVLQRGLSRFAGRDLRVDSEVFESEAATNLRNRGIAQLLQSYGRLAADPFETVELYTRQCSLLVSAHDLAVMGATLADGGVNPATGERVVSAQVCRDTLAVMATNGLYERSGEWLFEIGLPGKSGVSGGIVTIAPGKGGMGVFSPRLDSAGNSVRGGRATAYLSRALGLNLFASTDESGSSLD